MRTAQIPSDNLVCNECWKGVFSVSGWQTVLNTPQGYSYKTTWEGIRDSADHFTWCRLLARRNRKGEVAIRVACNEKSDCTPVGDRMLRIVVVGSLNYEFRYYMYTSEDDNAARFVAARERVRDLASPESYRLALRCLDNCLLQHTKCPKPQEDTILPDRVIDCSDTKKPRLVITRGQHSRYVALSYVWGASQPMMTTTQNVDRYCMEGLDMTLFPQTIQDAVMVTHNLGQRYLWIDAQCILQDSNADKARQLGMMCSIYRNSYFTINAASAHAATEGFLHADRPEKVPSARIPYHCPDGTVGAVWIAKWMDTDVPDASHSYWDEIEPISFRAWCLQERMLPPRSFIYASDTLKYYCQTETANIGGALCEPSTGMRLPNAIYHPQESVTFSEADRKMYRQAWLAALFVYTLRSISVPSDKLPALAGLAEQFQQVSRDEYLAGLWRRTLLLDLLWQSQIANPIRSSRAKAYRAPSWSWAAVDGLISIPYREESLSPGELRADIVHCEVTSKERELPFGEVTAGLLSIRAPIKEADLELKGSVRALVGEGLTEIGHVAYDDAEESTSGKPYIVALVWNSRAASVEGLVVVSTNGERYRRVGHFRSRSNSKDIKWLEESQLQEITIV